ncbi:MAG: SDR family NAD(P)-dependent oxidoreductase [bacterium]|nr:SDR family NAD(P)-dependent oxidoreductase [bacterium]
MIKKRGKDYLRNKVVVVSGAASGIGSAVALNLASRGARLALTDVNRKGLEEVAAKAKGKAADVETYEIDISRRDSVLAGIGEIVKKFGGIDGLINTAGILMMGPLYETPIEKAEKILDVNFKGTMLMCHACIPHIMKKRDGFVLNTSSVSWFYGAPNKLLYDSTKAGIYTMSQGLQMELEPYGISVGVCLPFMVETAMTQDMSNMPPIAVKLAKVTGMTKADMVAEKMIEAVIKNQFKILPGQEAKSMWRTFRFSPSLLGYMTKKMSAIKRPSD